MKKPFCLQCGLVACRKNSNFCTRVCAEIWAELNSSNYWYCLMTEIWNDPSFGHFCQINTNQNYYTTHPECAKFNKERMK